MKYLIYLSTASIYFRSELLEEMLINFRARNCSEEITGLLLYSYGQFLQYIEGDEKAVNRLMKKIEKDVRHHSLVIVETGQLPNGRIFPDWSMSFKDISVVERRGLEGFIDPSALELFSPLQLAHPVTLKLTAFAGRLKKAG